MSKPLTPTDAAAYLVRWAEVDAGNDCARHSRVTEAPLPQGLVQAATALVAWLDGAGAPGVIVGGVAASLLGRPRMTQDVDALTALPESRWPALLGSLSIRLPRVEDLMIMKAIAQRPRDLLDLEALLSRHPDSDLGRVRRFLDEFARAAAMPDLLSNWDRFVARRKPGVQDHG